MRQYKWKAMYFDADPNAVGSELEVLEADGELDRETVLRYAEKNPQSELYKCFEWNDDIASHKFRLYQATSILASISIVTKEKSENSSEQLTRAYVTIKNSEEKRKFKNIKLVLENDDEYAQLRKKAYEDLERCKEKYEKLIELEDLKEIVFDLYKSM